MKECSKNNKKTINLIKKISKTLVDNNKITIFAPET